MDLAVGHVAALKQILNPDFTGIKVSPELLQEENKRNIYFWYWDCPTRVR
jgi:hypothetical protein